MKKFVKRFASQLERQAKPLQVFVDGAGMRPDGTGSGYGWVRVDTGRQEAKWRDGLTNNQAEYRGVLFALRNVPEGTAVELLSDSQLVCYQLAGKYSVRDPKLRPLFLRVAELIRERRLNVKFSWVPREENLAGKFLEKARRPFGARSDEGR
jgi:ribonuclease HI